MRTVTIGIQEYEKIHERNAFYIDKTDFIRQWWESGDDVTLIARPRRFGKTLNMSMLETFFSVKFKERHELFEGLKIWETQKYRDLQGTYPVIFISFANVKEPDYDNTRKSINQAIEQLYIDNNFIRKSGVLQEKEAEFWDQVSMNMPEIIAVSAIQKLCSFMYRYYGKKVIVLLDEYDTPMQEAYVCGYWAELTSLIRRMFNTTFKTNPWLERAILTGITRISKESIFSDLNNLNVVTTTSVEYADCFGFTEKEVFSALDEYGLSGQKDAVKAWYDGFNFGSRSDIYNPWSIINFLNKKKLATYWANTSSNSLVNKLLMEGNREIKMDFEALLNEKTIVTELDEQIVYDQLSVSQSAAWSLLLASGYLKAVDIDFSIDDGEYVYTLQLTNREVLFMFRKMIAGWFSDREKVPYDDFLRALMQDNLKAMNDYMNQVALQTFSFFDSGNKVSENSDPERFYHGFVLGLLVDLRKQYAILSNRESGFGRYDVLLEPRDPKDTAYIFEFKIHDSKSGKTLEETAQSAIQQIRDRQYAATLEAKGIQNIRIYGFAFQGKKVLIVKG